MVKVLKLVIEDIVKEPKGENYSTYMGTKVRMNAAFLLETRQFRREWSNTFKILK